MKLKRNLLVLIMILVLTSCSTWRKLDNTEKGAVIGGTSGAAIGGAASGSPAGALLGGAAGAVGGGVIGHEMDKDERRRRRR